MLVLGVGQRWQEAAVPLRLLPLLVTGSCCDREAGICPMALHTVGVGCPGFEPGLRRARLCGLPDWFPFPEAWGWGRVGVGFLSSDPV